jgi:DNA-binding CsgD family transcriptional regulator
VRVTPRQREILKLSTKGLTEKEIALSLGISLATVRTHLERFYRSNGLKNKAEAIAFWLKHSTSSR